MKQIALLALVLAASACGGGSSAGGGSSNSAFVGSYAGPATVVVRNAAAPRAAHAEQNVALYVQSDGTVLLGGDTGAIYASAPLRTDQVRFEAQAGSAVGPECHGTLVLAGRFRSDADGNTVFDGAWSSEDLSCADSPWWLEGPVTATRTSDSVRVSAVLQSLQHPAAGVLRQVLNGPADESR